MKQFGDIVVRFISQNIPPKLSSIFDMMGYIARDFSAYAEYNVDEYMSSIGLAVSEEYKGLGIGKEILLARWEYNCIHPAVLIDRI